MDEKKINESLEVIYLVGFCWGLIEELLRGLVGLCCGYVLALFRLIDGFSVYLMGFKFWVQGFVGILFFC